MSIPTLAPTGAVTRLDSRDVSRLVAATLDGRVVGLVDDRHGEIVAYAVDDAVALDDLAQLPEMREEMNRMADRLAGVAERVEHDVVRHLDDLVGAWSRSTDAAYGDSDVIAERRDVAAFALVCAVEDGGSVRGAIRELSELIAELQSDLAGLAHVPTTT